MELMAAFQNRDESLFMITMVVGLLIVGWIALDWIGYDRITTKHKHTIRLVLGGVYVVIFLIVLGRSLIV